MKKIILTLALVAAAATSAMAQFSVGAGYLNQTATSNDKSSVASQGFYVGADAAYNLGYGISVVPGIYYGYLTNDNPASVNVFGHTVASGDVNTKSHYIAVPVNFKYGIGLGEMLNAFVYAGPQFELGLSSKTTSTGTLIGQSSSSTFDHYGDNADRNRFNISLGAGIGVDLAEMVRVNFGYHYGLLNMYKGDNSSDYKINNSYWSVGAAFLF